MRTYDRGGTIETHWLFTFGSNQNQQGAHHFDMWHVTLCSGLWHFHVTGGTLIHQH